MVFEDKLNNALVILETRKVVIQDIFKDLDQTGISYLLVGGMAVSFHGWDRFTRDMSILINAEDFNKIQHPNLEVLSKPKGSFARLRHKPLDVPIDVILGGTGIFPRLETIRPSDEYPRVISKEDLVVLKTKRGDPSDYGDIYKITQIGPSVDWDYVQKRVSDKAWIELQRVRHWNT